MALLKDLYSQGFYLNLSAALNKVLPDFDSKDFISKINVPAFQSMELKERMRHTTLVLHPFLSPTFEGAVEDLYKLIVQLRKDHYGEDHLAMMFLPDYIQHYGLDDYETSVKALKSITQFVSCEFAVRPFLIRYFDEMMTEMEKWSLHENHKVRRLASEGSRPALPWGLAVPQLKRDPSRILPILENLINDPSEWVRRSVANNLNDISKNQPEFVLAFAARWKGFSKETDAIIKHGCRSLLKQGHADILAHYNLESKNLELSGFEILTPEVKIGEHVEFGFKVRNADIVEQIVRLEYAVYYKRLNGQVSKKVFKISERNYGPAHEIAVRRKQSFKIITTRVYYPGAHQLSIIINGQESELKDFELLVQE
jgi:3-methyladenine DNA glycosylase AlkC